MYSDKTDCSLAIQGIVIYAIYKTDKLKNECPLPCF